MGWLDMPQGITEPQLREYLTDARGDLFIAASLAGCTPLQFRRAIGASETLQAFYLAIERVKVNPDYEKLSHEEFERQLNELSRDYRLDGLEAIHDIATMHADSAALYEVKLKAAVQLRGVGAGAQQSDSAMILAELNDLYHKNAPRIKSIRTQTVQIEFEGEENQGQQTPVLERVQIHLPASDDGVQ